MELQILAVAAVVEKATADQVLSFSNILIPAQSQSALD